MTLDKTQLLREYREWARLQRRMTKRAEKVLGIKRTPVDEHHCDILDGPCDWSKQYACYRTCFHRLPAAKQAAMIEELKSRNIEPSRQLIGLRSTQ